MDHGKLVRSHWKEALTLLPSFDWIFFNKELPAPCISRPEAMQAEGIVQHGKALIGELAQMLPELDQIRYSDGDLDAFCSELPPSEKKYLPRFLNQLLASGQITQEQYQKVLASQGVEAPPAKSLEDSLLFDLLTTCLERSLNANGCFIALLAKSNYEDPRFFEKVITDPFIDYSEEKIPSSDQEFLVMKAIKR
ncbi:MAG: hypothetical protein HYZ48_02770 [Chlamydiales bacterium]|nr:hypothetical protein [Chlamydiales bacterium]